MACALEVFAESPQRALTPAVINYSAATIAFELNRQWRARWRTSRSHRTWAPTLSVTSYSAAAGAREKVSQWRRAGEHWAWQRALEVWAEPQRAPMPDAINYSAATSAFKTSGLWRAHWRSSRGHRTRAPTLAAINYRAATIALELNGQWRAHWRSMRSHRSGL